MHAVTSRNFSSLWLLPLSPFLRGSHLASSTVFLIQTWTCLVRTSPTRYHGSALVTPLRHFAQVWLLTSWRSLLTSSQRMAFPTDSLRSSGWLQLQISCKVMAQESPINQLLSNGLTWTLMPIWFKSLPQKCQRIKHTSCKWLCHLLKTPRYA